MTASATPSWSPATIRQQARTLRPLVIISIISSSSSTFSISISTSVSINKYY